MKAQAYPPIGDYALLSDCHSGALVSKDGSIDWCTFHRFEARPVFARLLDWGKGGFFRIAPATDEYEVTRRHLPGTNVLETRFETPDGVIMLTDCFSVKTGTGHPEHRLIRHVRCDQGEVRVKAKFEPRFDYGVTEPRLEQVADLVLAYGGPDALVLQTDLGIGTAEISACETAQTLRVGDEAWLVLTWCLPHELEPRRLSREQIKTEFDETERFWREWSELCEYNGPYREQVSSQRPGAEGTDQRPDRGNRRRRHDVTARGDRGHPQLGLPLLVASRLLAHPERLVRARPDRGGSRVHGLAEANDSRSSEGASDHVRRRRRALPPRSGARPLRGRGSRPVRIGNGAASQFQLDVFGELLDTVWLYRQHGGDVDQIFWEFLTRVGGAVLDLWAEPDQGIWEIRGEPRHFVYSKVMAWVALDRLVKLAELDRREGDLDGWRAARDEIRDLIEREGVDGSVFTQSFGDGGKLDAANLMIPIVGFVAHDDPRARATVAKIADELSADGFIYRYVTDGVDGLSGDEATFAICSFWLVECLARGGEVDRARELFERLLSFCNDVGLLGEEIDPHSGEMLGNFPQAFSHLGIIQAAIALSEQPAAVVAA
jgi:GH15 family glucan-1,4-alpha-glucosidase